MKNKKRKNWIERLLDHTMSALKRFFRWIKRAFFGGKREMVRVAQTQIESPSKLLRQAFFRKKTAVIALVTITLLFLFVF